MTKPDTDLPETRKRVSVPSEISWNLHYCILQVLKMSDVLIPLTTLGNGPLALPSHPQSTKHTTHACMHACVVGPHPSLGGVHAPRGKRGGGLGCMHVGEVHASTRHR